MTDDEASPSRENEVDQRSGAAFDRIVGNVANSGVSAWLQTVTGSPEAASMLGGMVGPVAEEVSFAIRRILGLQGARAQRMIEEAAETADLSSKDLLDRLLEDPFKVELLLQALDAAGRSTTEAKLNLIAELLATGALAEDRPVVQEQRLALEAMAALEVPHFRLLILLAEPTPKWWDDEISRSKLRYAWSEEKIVEKDPGLANALGALAARLQSLGLIRDIGTAAGSGTLWERTPFGLLCIEALQQRSSGDLEKWGSADYEAKSGR